MDLNELTAAKIKELRKELGISAEAMATDLGMSKTAFSQLENGKVDITLKRVEAISKVYNFPVAAIIPSLNTVTQISNGSGANVSTNFNSFNYYNTSPEEKL